MSDELPGDAPEIVTGGEARQQLGMISAESALRVVLALLAVWTLFSGMALIFFQEGADATIGGGLEGGQGQAAQRLLGVHLLVLTPIYGLIVWKPRQYWSLLWMPYAAQIGVVIVSLYDMASGDRDAQNAALPLVVSLVFAVLLIYIWWAGRRQAQQAEEELRAPPPALAAPSEEPGPAGND